MKTKSVLATVGIWSAIILVASIGVWKSGLLAGLTGQPAYDAHAGHAHGSGEKSSQVTVWTDQVEIFLEHPFVVVDTPTEFVTHVTNRTTWAPRRQGPVTFVLSRDSKVLARHWEPAPARDGIYIPRLTFPEPGAWSVSLVIPLKTGEHIVELPGLTVYASQADADHAPSPQEIEGISFLKEQQWKIPFRTEPVRQQQLLSQQVLAVPESAIVDEDQESVAFVQIAGEAFQERLLKLGKRANGRVEVVSGLSEGEYVAIEGAHAIAEAEHATSQGHAHDAHDDAAQDAHDHAAHDEEPVVELSNEQIRRFGIEVGSVGPGELDVHVTLAGEVVINADRMAHIVPTVSGIVRQVLKNVGDTVKGGEVIAWLESAELGKARLDYLAKWAEVGCCTIDLTRTQEVHDNTVTLLEILKSSPSLETLQNTNGVAMGDNRSKLISAYAEYALTKATYLREKSLFEQKLSISSEQDFLKAKNALEKADAGYTAVCDSVAFEVRRSLLEAQRMQQLREMELKGAERQLKILGLTSKDISELEFLAQNQNPTPDGEAKCPDPNCEKCAAKRRIAVDSARTEERLAWYPLRGPFDGTVIGKHIALGEMAKDDSDVFVIADLSTVWVDLRIHQKDLAFVHKGGSVNISAKSAMPDAEGIISYIDPVIDETTRTALARVVLDNSSGLFRPGIFVSAEVLAKKLAADVVVAKSVIQDLDDTTSVFVRNEHGFEPRAVAVGWSNDEYVEIVSGLTPGEKIATRNSFRLKAELKKDAGGGCAGHGHAH